MSIAWKAYQLAESIKHRKTLKLCVRCETLYQKKLDACPACSDISDSELDKLLNKKDNEVHNIGKTMLSFVATFLILMFIIYGAIYYYNT